MGQIKMDLGNNGKVTLLPLEEVMHSSMMPYAEYVILERALPRVEDGLKPVQRRILYTMMELGLTPDKPHRKSARIVGDTLGKYHPHGDTSVYDAMVRMAQDFNMQAPLVDGHGNFGSIDGDSAAAMRYTEARLSPIAMELLRDIDKDTVDFSLNFDDTLKEPDTLPGRYPNLLVNGASGIAVGFATNIPPHNLAEVIDGVSAYIANPNIALDEMMKIIKGPDFPTGGYLIDDGELVKAYQTGKGRVYLRAKTRIEKAANGKHSIVITELPYQVNKAAMLEKILKLSEEKKGILTGIADIRDESDRDGMRAIIEVRKDADPVKILNYLFKYSDLQTTFGINIVAIADGKPQQMGLLDIITYYVEYQKQVVTRRTKYDLENALKREHILEGLIIAVSNIDEVIRIIKTSKDPKEARERLMARFSLSEIQAQAILDMRLQRLTGLEIEKLKQEYAQVKALIKKLQAILSSKTKLMQVIVDELGEIRRNHAKPRKTQELGAQPKIEIEEEKPESEECVVVLNRGGQIKRMQPKAFQFNGEGGPQKESEHIRGAILTATDRKLQFFTNLGNCFTLECSTIPQAKLKEKGALLPGLLSGLEKGEEIVAMFSFTRYPQDAYLNFYTREGMVKSTAIAEYESKKGKIAACKLHEGDRVLRVEPEKPGLNALIITKMGFAIKFPMDDMPRTGRATAGVKGIKLADGDEAIFAQQVQEDAKAALITQTGYGKCIPVSEIEKQGRNGKGAKVFTFAKNGANGKVLIAAFHIQKHFDMGLVLARGEVAAIPTKDVPAESKVSGGVPLLPGREEIREAFKIFGNT